MRASIPLVDQIDRGRDRRRALRSAVRQRGGRLPINTDPLVRDRILPMVPTSPALPARLRTGGEPRPQWIPRESGERSTASAGPGACHRPERQARLLSGPGQCPNARTCSSRPRPPPNNNALPFFFPTPKTKQTNCKGTGTTRGTKKRTKEKETITINPDPPGARPPPPPLEKSFPGRRAFATQHLAGRQPPTSALRSGPVAAPGPALRLSSSPDSREDH